MDVLARQESISLRDRLFYQDARRGREAYAIWKVLLAIVLLAGSATAEGFGKGILRQVLFSPNGKYVFAQDDSEITVLAADSLRVLFRVHADMQVLGHFTPDSREIVFVRAMTPVVQGQIQGPEGAPRVERWRISDCTQVASTSIPSLICGTASLSPDGRTLACDDFKGTLHVIDVASGEETLTKEKFARPRELIDDIGVSVYPARLWTADFEFSPDGRFLIGLPEDEGAAVLWDADARHVVKSQGDVKLISNAAVTANFFAFAEPGRLAIVRARWLSWRKGWKCSVETVAFPSGDVVSTREIPRCPGGLSFEAGPIANPREDRVTGRAQRPFRRATDPNFLIIDYVKVIDRGTTVVNTDRSTPSISFRGRIARIDTCAVEAKTGRIIQSGSLALDVFGNRYVTEVSPGEVGLWEIGKGLLTSIVVSKK